jgi:hypothetical protein
MAMVDSSEHCSVYASAINLFIAMQHLISKFDKHDLMMYLYLGPRPINPLEAVKLA